ncbi:HMG-box domain-containing protein NDAI_0E03570 [Naumovozyma dairenensis CBS 421]|uniref:HMG box domain-containing protein n=1 Tax=Naumovozyma dairenensis (strain ATCC 10597 / BCRC 20456 / CBS 421 / NBRC 0211 / NRRL Y-12639) TaxID=1071378 RepID=G0WBQ4_NAUDC|nr:hypothetical protein NDAI_0E03570 [Naumovozyma dairenensis CBS 421]CCD25174.1 hypothetical protein NDAI_0E03570 [Naumovozyma dairenensis CBS 421]
MICSNIPTSSIPRYNGANISFPTYLSKTTSAYSVLPTNTDTRTSFNPYTTTTRSSLSMGSILGPETPPSSRHSSVISSPLTKSPFQPVTNFNVQQQDQQPIINDACSCKKNSHNKHNGSIYSETHIPRPRNAFILFRQHLHHTLFPKEKEMLIKEGSFKANSQVSRDIGQRWRQLTDEEKKYWQDLAQKEKEWHKKKYPNYKYTPRSKEPSVVGTDGTISEPKKLRKGKSSPCDFCKSKKKLVVTKKITSRI